MARGGGLFGDSNRDGINDEIDRVPGNPGTSREYAEKYDRRTEQEYSNQLETPNRIEAARILAEMEQEGINARDAMKAAQSNVHFFPSVGKFIIPPENTWAAHAELVKDDNVRLNFNPEKYVYFDKIVAEKFGNPALTDPTHPDYQKYEGLRTNLEVLRNDIIGIYLNDGGFDPGDEIFIPKIAGVAAAIGEGLAADKWYKRLFMNSISVDVANVEGVGAREIYKHLLEVQEPASRDTPIRNYLTSMLGIPNHSWSLPPLEQTPYSAQGLSAPPPMKGCPPLSPAVGNAPLQALDASEQSANRAERAVSLARRLNTPQSLDVPTQEKSIDEARTILRWLKNLQFGEKPMEEWIGAGSPAEQTAKSEAVARLIELYGGQIKMAANEFPGIANSLVINSANEAAGAIALAVGDHALDNLPDNHPRILTLENAMENIPPAWEGRENHSASRLLEMIETGIEWSSGKNVSDKTAIERLVEMSNRIQANAKKLQSIDTLKAPARIESVELAREILRKLKGLGFADKPVESLIKPGNLDDKAALAQQLSEMVEMYGNILAEAAQTNSEILKDKRVIDANIAVGELTHTVKLMAAKEIPVSMAASQQISADITQMPEEWKNMHDRTIDRLVKSMEGGLEKAMGELQAQQEQAQQQDEELASKSVEAAISDGTRRRKRRRRGSSSGKSSPSLTKSAKRRNAADLNGDGVADRLQGLGLSDKDLLAVRELGGSLRNIGNQASTLTPPEILAEGAAIAPDDKSFAARKTERDDQNKTRPGNRNNRPQI